MDRKLAIPLIIMAALIDIGCFLVSARVPFQHFWFVLAALFVTGTLIWLLVDRSWAARTFCGMIAAGTLCGWVVGAAIWRGCPSNAAMLAHPDAWAYCALARYLWYNPRGADVGLSTIDQYASHMQGGRFATASLLNFISGFSHPGDPASAMMVYLGISSVALFLSVFFLSRCLGLRVVTSALAALFAIASGWLSNALLIANFDNVIFLALFATLLGFVVRFSASEPTPWRDLVASTLLLAACFYTYPEGLAIGLVLASPLLVWYALSIAQDIKELARNALWLLCAAVVAAPYLNIGTAFLLHQVSFGSGGARPGTGNFDGLLTSSFLPALFALGEEYPNSTFSIINLALPLLMILVFVAGSRAISRNNRRFLLVIFPLAALVLWQGYFSRYTYGLFKVIFCASWWYCPILALGTEAIADKIWPRHRSFAIGALGAGLITLVVIERLEDFATMVWKGAPCISSERELEELKYVAPGKTIMLNVANDFDYVWAAYYLRDLNILTPQPRSYLAMPHVAPLLALARGSQQAAAAGLSLVSGSHPEAIWSNRTFSLISLDIPQILKVESPNGLEQYQGEPFFWLGTQPVRITVRTPCTGIFLLKASKFMLGPSAPELGFRTIVLEAGVSRKEYKFTPASDGIPIQLEKGTHEFKIWCSNRPSVLVQPNGDKRPILLGMGGYYLAKASCQ